jgi:DNA-binding CsgD family transcriptional regulator
MAGRARAVPVRMTFKRHRQLKQIIAAGTSPQRLVLRARIALAAAEGKVNAAIARELGCSANTVRTWRGSAGRASRWPAVEEHRVTTGPGGHLDGARGIRPLDVAPRRAVDPVHHVAARNDLKLPLPGSETSESQYASFTDSRDRGVVSISRFCLPPSWCQSNRNGIAYPERRMDIEVRVVDVNVPAESRPHIGKRGRVVGQAGDFRAVRNRAEQVHRAVRAQ